MFEGFTRTEIKTSGARIVAVIGGKGAPVLLMHGNPFTHASWHKIAPRLADEFTVVATDLRGYGDSEKPPGGPDHSGYSFRAMAQDQIEVMATLGFDRFYAAGHDRGARVLHRMCLDHPGKVARAAILDILPQHHLLNNVTRAWGTFSWHWFFNIQPYDLPERLMGADPDYFIRRKLAKTEQGLSFFDPARPTSRRAAKSAARCCCYGGRPGGSAAITARWTSGRAMPWTSGARRRCLAATICPRRPRTRLFGSCGSFSPRRSRGCRPWPDGRTPNLRQLILMKGACSAVIISAPEDESVRMPEARRADRAQWNPVSLDRALTAGRKPS